MMPSTLTFSITTDSLAQYPSPLRSGKTELLPLTIPITLAMILHGANTSSAL